MLYKNVKITSLSVKSADQQIFSLGFPSADGEKINDDMSLCLNVCLSACVWVKQFKISLITHIQPKL